MPSRALVVDANILVRAVLGQRVRDVIAASAGNVSFFVPETAFVEAEEHVAALALKRGGDPHIALAILASALALGCPIWTEDTDFFGCGVATWTTDRVQMFLRE